MTSLRALALALPLLLPSIALAQDTEQSPEPPQRGSPLPQQRAIPDLPLGAPYYAGLAAHRDQSSNDVPLRDYMSSRVDQLRSETMDRLELMTRQVQQVIDERDKQYAQRFAAQQEALTAALSAAEKAVANALQAAKEAVTKAEEGANKRFESVNEFRGQLDDQANTFLSKDAAEARFRSLDDKITNLLDRANTTTSRLDSIKAVGEGNANLWALIGGAVLLLLAIVGFALTILRDRAARAVHV